MILAKRLIKKIRLKYKLFPNMVECKDIKFIDLKSSKILEEIYSSGIYEYEIIKFLDYFKYDNFVEIGSNIGFFSLYVKKHKNWNIEAYEPYSKTYKFAKKLMELNNLFYNLKNEAVSSKDGLSKLYIPKAKKFSVYSGCASLNKPNETFEKMYGEQDYLTEEVKTISLNKIVSSYKTQKTLIKIDAEGKEFDMLSSLKNLKKILNIDFIVEMNIYDKTKKNLFDLFTKSGFKSYLMTNLGLIKQDRPLTLPKYDILLNSKDHMHRPAWRNHFFTKKKSQNIFKKNLDIFGCNI